jgi:LEA14-like dessication related protein
MSYPPLPPALRTLLLAVAALTLSACASLQSRDPVQVTVAGVESLPGKGFELRMLIKLRVQNPNDTPIEYDGVYLKLDVQETTFATGVSDERGSVPRFGESIIGVTVTVSTMGMARYLVGMLEGKPIDKISYELEGKLNGPAFMPMRFQSRGELVLPSGMLRRTTP